MYRACPRHKCRWTAQSRASLSERRYNDLHSHKKPSTSVNRARGNGQTHKVACRVDIVLAFRNGLKGAFVFRLRSFGEVKKKGKFLVQTNYQGR